MAGETPQVTHTYFSRAWFKDPQTWLLIVGFLWFLANEPTFTTAIPLAAQIWVGRIVLIGALFLRFQSAHRPVASRDGVPVEVHSIPPTA